MTKYGVSAQILLIIGWPTETEDEFQETLDMLTKMKKDAYKIQHINLGGTFKTAKHHETYTQFDFEFDRHGNWVLGNNDMLLRIDRWMRVYNHCQNIGLTIDAKHIHRLKKMRELYNDQ